MTTNEVDELANMLAYNEQDLLDSIANGGRFNFKQEEKRIKKMILEALARASHKNKKKEGKK